MVKQSFLSKYPDVRFPVGLQPCEDGLFTHRLLALTNKLAANPDGIYNYRSHEEQNHIQINQSCTKILEQIPQWFKILDGFYKKYNLYQTKSLHLARFIEHEPIELRLLSMPFSYNQKKELSKIICTFMQKNVCYYLSKEEFNLLDWKLRYLIKNYNPSLLICIHLLQITIVIITNIITIVNKLAKYFLFYNQLTSNLYVFSLIGNIISSSSVLIGISKAIIPVVISPGLIVTLIKFVLL